MQDVFASKQLPEKIQGNMCNNTFARRFARKRAITHCQGKLARQKHAQFARKHRNYLLS